MIIIMIKLNVSGKFRILTPGYIATYVQPKHSDIIIRRDKLPQILFHYGNNRINYIHLSLTDHTTYHTVPLNVSQATNTTQHEHHRLNVMHHRRSVHPNYPFTTTCSDVLPHIFYIMTANLRSMIDNHRQSSTKLNISNLFLQCLIHMADLRSDYASFYIHFSFHNSKLGPILDNSSPIIFQILRTVQ